MKGGATISLSLALALGAFVSPHVARAANINTNSSKPATQSSAMAMKEAARMVPATVDLKKDIDARKVHPGDQFQAVLQKDVQLKNGPKLDRGTVLLGTVTADQTNPGNSRLALRFTRARLKNGQSIPIKATVIELANPQGVEGTSLADESGLWSPTTLRVDQIGAVSGVDLHSAIASDNSAVLVSQKKNDVKLDAGSQMVVAIAGRHSRNNSARNGA